MKVIDCGADDLFLVMGGDKNEEAGLVRYQFIVPFGFPKSVEGQEHIVKEVHIHV